MARIRIHITSLVVGCLATIASPQGSSSTNLGTAAIVSEADESFSALLASNTRAPFSLTGVQPSELYVAMLDLAAAGSGRALAWCARHLEHAPPDLRANPAFGVALFRQLIERHRGESWLDDPTLEPARSIELASPAVREGLLAMLDALGLNHEPLVLFLRATALSPRSEQHAGRTEEARRLLRDLRAAHPDHPLARRAEALDWRLRNLAPGVRAPELGLRDVDGNELRLSDHEGKVVLIDVWSFDDPDLRQRIERRRAVQSKFRSSPFRILGVGLVDDEQDFRIDLEELDLGWPTSFEGSLEGPAAQAWRLDGGSTTVLIDRQGVVRSIGLEGESLDQRIEHLLRTPTREERSPDRRVEDRRRPSVAPPAGRR